METESKGVIPKQMENSHGISNSDRENNLKSEESMDVEKDKHQTNDIGEAKFKHVHFDDKVNVILQNGSDKTIVEVEELAEMASSQKWVHMDRVEAEKLEWMKDCPTPSAVRKEVHLIVVLVCPSLSPSFHPSLHPSILLFIVWFSLFIHPSNHQPFHPSSIH